jgi:hypothetical protein
MSRRINNMLGSANMKSAAPLQHERIGLLLVALAYAPFLAWSLLGAGWALWHYRFTLWFTGAYLLVVLHSLVFKRTVGGATVMAGLGGCHLFTAFALHTWLHLPIWTVAIFLAASLTLLVSLRVRSASAHFRLTKPRQPDIS